jgi:hypothetical protein
MVRIAREQVEQYLSSLRDLPNVPDDPAELYAVMQANAQRGQSDAKRFFGVDLTSDEAGVKALDGLLTDMHTAISPGIFRKWSGGKISAEAAGRVAMTLGAFYGEILREQSNGVWRFAEFQGQQVVALALTAKRSVTPLHKVAKHFTNGKSDSIWSFHALTRLLAKAAARVNNMSEEEREALRANFKAQQAERKRRRNDPSTA